MRIPLFPKCLLLNLFALTALLFLKMFSLLHYVNVLLLVSYLFLFNSFKRVVFVFFSNRTRKPVIVVLFI